MIKANVKVSAKDSLSKLAAVIRDMSKLQAYVGIPEETASRKKGEINNAQLALLHSHGSPLQHIPPRPFIEPAIEAEDNKKAIADELGQAVKSTLAGKKAEARQHLRAAGKTGQNAARGWFVDPRNNWAQNTPATAKRKLAKLGGQAGKDLRQAVDMGLITASELATPLIDTGQLRKAIIFIIDGEAHND